VKRPTMKKGKGHHGRAARLVTGKRYLLVTAANYSVPVQVVGTIPNGGGRFILLRTTR